MSDAPNPAPSLYNPNAPEAYTNPYPGYERLREEAPVYFWSEGSCYIVSRFEDVALVMRDSRFTPNAQDVGRPARADALPPELRFIIQKSLLNLPAQDHLRVRRAVSPAFTPRAVERLRPNIQHIVDAALARQAGQDVLEVAEFADYIPVRVIASMLQIPREHEATFRNFGESFVKGTDPQLTTQQREVLFRDIPPGVKLLADIIEERRKNPGEDLLSTLIRAEEAGDTMSTEEMIALVVTLLGAGSETAVHFIGFVVMNLLRTPGLLEQVRREPALLRGVMEEVLRWDNFNKMGTIRYAREDVELSGTRIPQGAQVMAFISSALRDPRAYPDADSFDVRREPGETLQFGTGAHFCLGASLARLECEVAVSTLLQRFPHLRLASEPVFGPHPIMRRLAWLPVALSPPQE
jgi:cytochrome P450